MGTTTVLVDLGDLVELYDGLSELVAENSGDYYTDGVSDDLSIALRSPVFDEVRHMYANLPFDLNDDWSGDDNGGVPDPNLAEKAYD